MAVVGLLQRHGGDGGATAVLVRCRGGHGGAAAIALRIGPTRGGTAEVLNKLKVSAVPPRRSAVLSFPRCYGDQCRCHGPGVVPCQE